MKRAIAIPALLTLSLSSAVGGCTSPHPYIREGNANGVEISYYGDIATTLPLANQHCARYERIPRLTDSGVYTAVYDCVHR